MFRVNAMHIDIVIFKKESKGFNPNQNSFGCVLQKLQSYKNSIC